MNKLLARYLADFNRIPKWLDADPEATATLLTWGITMAMIGCVIWLYW